MDGHGTQLGMTVLKQFSRFGIIGVITTVTHVIVAIGLIELFQTHPVPANGLAFISANLLSYFANTLWSFNQRPGLQSFRRFVLVSLLGFCLTLAITTAVAAAGLPYQLGIGLVVLLLPVMSFCAHALWTYKTAPLPVKTSSRSCS
jgi:putative flippase GtrA